MCGQSLSEGLPVTRSKSLSFNSAQCNWLYASSVEPESGAEAGETQGAQFDPALLVLLETVLQGGDAPSSACLVIYA